jgi:hypothetical protein
MAFVSRSMCVLALGFALAVPATSMAFFPPGDITPTVPVPPVDPPTGGGTGEPEPEEPETPPNTQTPEPATIVTALTGLTLLAGARLRKRLRQSEVVA